MPIYSAHAVIRMIRGRTNEGYLFDKEHEDFGYLLPGGRFEKIDAKDLEASGFRNEREVSKRVLVRELREELNALTIDLTESTSWQHNNNESRVYLEIYYGWKPDDIKTKSGKTYRVDRMYFWGATIGPTNLSALQKNAKPELRIMKIPEIQSEVLSPAMRKIVEEDAEK
jgi:8-oxo-dGTP pyrophosphatase MutT (NUDIX family)